MALVMSAFLMPGTTQIFQAQLCSYIECTAVRAMNAFKERCVNRAVSDMIRSHEACLTLTLTNSLSSFYAVV